MKTYIGTKIIKAEPMTYGDFCKDQQMEKESYNKVEDEGYKVVYPDGYGSWSPKEVFENVYREVNDNEIKLIKGGK